MTADAPERDPEHWFHVRATLHVETAILFHLNQAGVFEHLDRHGPATAARIASDRDLVPGVLETLLDYIVGVDRILDRDAEGRFSFTDFGQAVLDRYGAPGPDGRVFNLFDVRAGAYEPVWRGLGGLLTGEVVYGKELLRHGDHAAQGVLKSARAMAPTLGAVLESHGVVAAVEWGVSTALLQVLSDTHPALALAGIDRNPATLRDAAQRTDADVTWIAADVFQPDAWLPSLPSNGPGALFSVHLHELMAAGEDTVVELLRTLRERLPGWIVVALEQPRLHPSERDTLPEARWLYGQSNVLIHHLIGNGRVLTDEGWRDLLGRSGATLHPPVDVGFLGYRAYVATL